jgi:hypothetical protein
MLRSWSSTLWSVSMSWSVIKRLSTTAPNARRESRVVSTR